MNDTHPRRRQRFYKQLNEGEALILFVGSAPRKSGGNFSFR